MHRFWQKTRSLVGRIEWVNFLFITLSPVAAILGTIWVVKQGGPHPATWILAFVIMMATGLGITAGYHRLYSHLTYKTSPVVELLLVLLGGAAFEGSVKEWCQAHRKHHRHVDHDGDPYNIQEGFWHAHVGWVILKADQSDDSNIPDLKRNRLVMWQDRNYIRLAILVSFVLPTALAALWGDPLGGFFIAGMLRVVLNHHLTFCINSYCHFFGRQPYSDRDSSRDSWIAAFLTYGEGFHNFHHTFAADYRNGIKAYHWDPAKWMINLLAWIGLAKDVRRVSPQRILAAKLEMDQKRLERRAARQAERMADWEALLQKTRTNLEELHARWIELKAEYRQAKQLKTDAMEKRLAELKVQIQEAKREFRYALAHWRVLIRSGLAPVAE